MRFPQELGPATCSGELTCVGAGIDGIKELGSSEATEGEMMSCADAFDVFDDAAPLFHARLRFPIALRELAFKRPSHAIETRKASRQGLYTQNVMPKYTEASKN